jgi:hypothetical protein
MKRIEVKPGTVFGELSVLKEVESSGKRRFLCKCDCGAKVEVRLDHLRSGHTSSCGSCGIFHNGRRMTIKQWAKAYGLNESTLRARLKNMSIREALERSLRS